jgi:hypothetical protein
LLEIAVLTSQLERLSLSSVPCRSDSGHSSHAFCRKRGQRPRFRQKVCDELPESNRHEVRRRTEPSQTDRLSREAARGGPFEMAWSFCGSSGGCSSANCANSVPIRAVNQQFVPICALKSLSWDNLWPQVPELGQFVPTSPRIGTICALKSPNWDNLCLKSLLGTNNLGQFVPRNVSTLPYIGGFFFCKKYISLCKTFVGQGETMNAPQNNSKRMATSSSRIGTICGIWDNLCLKSLLGTNNLGQFVPQVPTWDKQFGTICAAECFNFTLYWGILFL